jgi:hypothetical protein
VTSDVLAVEGGVDVDPDAGRAAPGGHGDLGDLGPLLTHVPQGCRREVAQDGLIAAREHGCRGAGDGLGTWVADGVDAAEDLYQSALRQPSADLVRRNTQLKKLPPCNVAELCGSEGGDPPKPWNA